MRFAFLLMAIMPGVSGVISFSTDCAATEKDTIEKEKRKLIGTWKPISFRHSEIPREDTTAAEKTRITIDDGKLAYRFLDVLQYTYTINPSADPKTLDMTVAEGKAKGTVIQGIYKFDGERLVLCLERTGLGERPTEFGTPKGKTWDLIVLERLKD